MIKYLSLSVTVLLCYLILHDVNRFISESELIVFSLSHFAVHIILRDIFNDQLSFGLYFVTNMIIMFSKSFFIYWILFNQNYLDNPSCYYYIVITALQSIIFSKYILRKSLYTKITTNRITMFIINIGDKLCQSEFMIMVLLFKKSSIYPQFDPDILVLTAYGAWMLIPIVIVVMRDYGCSFREYFQNLVPWFNNAGFVYFSSVFLTYEWQKHKSLKSEFLIYVGRYFPEILTDEGLKMMVLIAFILVETYYQLAWQRKQCKKLKIEEKEKKKQQKKIQKKLRKEIKQSEAKPLEAEESKGTPKVMKEEKKLAQKKKKQ